MKRILKLRSVSSNLQFSLFIIVTACFLTSGCSRSASIVLILTENYEKGSKEQILSRRENIDENTGTEITLFFNSGLELNGELLFVRDTSLILCSIFTVDEKDLAAGMFPIVSVPQREIKQIKLDGTDYGFLVPVCSLGGLLVGTIVGSAFVEKGRGEMEGLTAVLGSGIGLLVGGITGEILSRKYSEDELILINIPDDFDYSILNPLARYPDEEPEFLKQIK